MATVQPKLFSKGWKLSKEEVKGPDQEHTYIHPKHGTLVHSKSSGEDGCVEHNNKLLTSDHEFNSYINKL